MSKNISQIQVGVFSGEELVVIGDEISGFELHFFGFIERIYPTIEHAKAAAPTFARVVLAHIRAGQRSAGN